MRLIAMRHQLNFPEDKTMGRNRVQASISPSYGCETFGTLEGFSVFKVNSYFFFDPY